ncbi:hypothetical protein FNF27_06363 [Cafeteria roenbergensis]|uniref:MACPF domain-containing protein n=1 Tax=Cafeteria roenbergensis TaxID=33653 RepID=A0A5A8E2Q2_CAFRO|nr:hypothetical protein FNF27_06363 [Cafeteria roenbergensis]
MRTAVLALVGAAAASAQMLQNWVPGICGAGSLTPTVGVGCGVLGSDLKMYAPPEASQYKIKPIIQNMPCMPQCYIPGHETDPECQYCVYVNTLYPDQPFKVPKNVFVTEWTGSSTCFEHTSMESWDNLAQQTGHTSSHSGWFSWHSTTTLNFMNRYFKDMASLSMLVQRYIYSSIVLFPQQQLDPDFETYISILPTEFNSSTQAAFFEFINNYGTHYIDSAFMGGSAVLTSFFESCLLSTMSGQWVYKESGGSFFGIFNHDHKHASGFNKTSCLYYENSNSSVNLYGGNGAKWGDFNWTHPVSPNFTKDWADTLYSDQIPAVFNLQPLPLIFPAQYSKQAVALNTSIQAYFDVIGAKNDAIAKSMGPRQNPKPSWCKDPNPPAAYYDSVSGDNPNCSNSTESLAVAADPPPLPKCPNMLAELEVRRRQAEEVALALELGIAPPTFK